MLKNSENNGTVKIGLVLRWRHNGRVSVSNHQLHDYLLNRLFRRRSKKTSKLRVTGLCPRNSPWTGEFPAQMVSNAENVSIWWRHHVTPTPGLLCKAILDMAQCYLILGNRPRRFLAYVSCVSEITPYNIRSDLMCRDELSQWGAIMHAIWTVIWRQVVQIGGYPRS